MKTQKNRKGISSIFLFSLFAIFTISSFATLQQEAKAIAPPALPNDCFGIDGKEAWAQEGERTQCILDTKTGHNKCIADAEFVCKEGKWVIEGMYPKPIPRPKEGCFGANGEKVWVKEGTETQCILDPKTGYKKCIADAKFICKDGEWVKKGVYRPIPRPKEGCFGANGEKVWVKEGTETQCILDSKTGYKKCIADAKFICKDGEWVKKGVYRPIPRPKEGCFGANGEKVWVKEGTETQCILDSKTGYKKCIADAKFICKDGKWIKKGAYPNPLPKPKDGCFGVDGKEVWAKEGARTQCILESTGYKRCIADGEFVCRKGQWIPEGTYPKPKPLLQPKKPKPKPEPKPIPPSKEELLLKKLQPKLEAMLERIEEKLVKNPKLSTSEKIKKLTQLQLKLQTWARGNYYKRIISEYLRKRILNWVAVLKNEEALGAQLEDLFKEVLR